MQRGPWAVGRVSYVVCRVSFVAGAEVGDRVGESELGSQLGDWVQARAYEYFGVKWMERERQLSHAVCVSVYKCVCISVCV